MTDMVFGLSPSSAAAATLAVTGLGLIQRCPGPALATAAVLGAVIACWVGLWHAMGPAIGVMALYLAPEGLGWRGIAMVNLSVATATWLPFALVFIPMWRRNRSIKWAYLRTTTLFLIALIWFLGLVFPGLGQAGNWPLESVALAIWTSVLALGLVGRRAGYRVSGNQR